MRGYATLPTVRLTVLAATLLLGLPWQGLGADHAGHGERLSREATQQLRSSAPAEKSAWSSEAKGARFSDGEKGTWSAQGRIGSAAAMRAPAGTCDWSSQYAYGGVYGPVFAQVVYDDGSGEALYVGGDILIAGGVPVFGIAKWDGSSWSALGSGMDDIVYALAVFDDGTGEALYAGGYFTEAGGVPAVGIAKWDGSSWSPVGTGVDDSVFALAVYDDGTGAALYAGGYFSTAGGALADNIAKWDGSSWSALGLGVDDEIDALTVFDDGSGGGPMLYAGGFFESAGGAPADYIAKWDGSSWSAVGLGMSDGVVALETFDDGGGEALYAGGFFEYAEGSPVYGIAKWDDASWSDLDTGMDYPVLSLQVHDDGSGEALYVGGFFFLAGSDPVVSPGIARWDGSEWSAVPGLDMGIEFFVEVYSLTEFDDGSGSDLYAGGLFAGFHASWDGAEWSLVTATGPDFMGLDGTVYALAVYDDGSGPALYAGGDFFFAGGVPVYGIAKWDGSSWSALGTGLGCFSAPWLFSCFPMVEALAVYDDGSGPALYAGGIFDYAGAVTAANIAKWDGTEWSALDSGTDDIVEGLAVYDDGSGPALFAGGEFENVGSTPLPASRVARWDGTAWSALGLGVDADVETLAVYDDGSGPDLYVGGELLNAGGQPASYIARWDGATWSALGSGLDDEVETLLVFDDGNGEDLYVGGSFNTAGGVAAPSIARWNGSTWSALGLGMSCSVEEWRTVDSLAAFDDGTGTNLYAGGYFDHAGGTAAANIARWDGASWSAVGAGTDEEVEALAVFNAGGPSLYAGGYFWVAGENLSFFFAEWQCAPAELSINDVTLSEGDTPTDFTFTVSRSHNATDLQVDVATSAGTATAGVDYTTLSQTLSFAAGGALAQPVTVVVTGDTIEEPAIETFTVDLSNPVSATLLDPQGVGSILDDDDDGPPSVTVLDSSAGTGDGVLEPCEEAHVAIDRLLVTFDRPVRNPAGDTAGDDVTNPANYRLFFAGPDHDLASTACTAPVGDDEAVSIDLVSYADATLTATLDLAGGSVLADGLYRLVVCDTVVDAAGNGLAGGDFVQTFRIEQENLFVNGHFDCDLESWALDAENPATLTHDANDVDAALASGSLALANLSTSTDVTIDQCVPVTPETSYLLSASLWLSAASETSLILDRHCSFFSASSCVGPSLHTAVDLLQVSDTAGSWQVVAGELTSAAGSVSAQCGFRLVALSDLGADAWLDDLALVLQTGGVIFADDFESGNTLAWSVTVP